MSENPKTSGHPSPLDRYAPKPPPLPVPDHPLVTEVMQGKRYVTYPFVFSILILSFQRSVGGVRVVETGKWPVGPLFGAAVVTILFGWWGFPWGLLWTPLALFHLWNGGRDSTRDILSKAIGVPEARRVLSLAPKARPPAAIWFVRSLILFPVLLIGSLFISIITSEGAR